MAGATPNWTRHPGKRPTWPLNAPRADRASDVHGQSHNMWTVVPLPPHILHTSGTEGSRRWR
eukprot:14137664-Alexandrium_andersonii.AAC.1